MGSPTIHDLEAPFQRRILLDVLAILIEGGCADSAQLAARQRRLEHVRSIDSTFGCARTHQGVQFVDEQDDLPVRLFNILEHCFQAVFELPTILSAGQHGAEVERDHSLVAQQFRHIAGENAPRQSFHDGRLANARFANEHRIVLGAPRQHLDHAANFFIPANHRVKLAPARQFRQVLGIAVKGLVLALRSLVGHSLVAAHGGQAFEDCVAGSALRCQRKLRRIILQLRQCQQQVLGRHVLVFKIFCFFGGVVQHLLQVVGEAGLRRGSAYLGQAGDSVANTGVQLFGAHSNLLQHGNDDAVFVFQQRHEQVQGKHFRLTVLIGQGTGLLNRLLRFQCEFVPTNCHYFSLPLNGVSSLPEGK